QWIELDIELLDVGDEIHVLDHRVEGIAQHLHALGRNSGWRDDAATDGATARVECIDLLIFRAGPDFRQSRSIRHVLGAFRSGLQNDANLAVAQPFFLADAYRRPG